MQVHAFLDRFTGLVFLKSEFSLKAARSKAILFHEKLWSRRGQGCNRMSVLLVAYVHMVLCTFKCVRWTVKLGSGKTAEDLQHPSGKAVLVGERRFKP